jgi:NAD(P)-dependent dehydrogenase (short-subunit alcohol dehydrogenase family)
VDLFDAHARSMGQPEARVETRRGPEVAIFDVEADDPGMADLAGRTCLVTGATSGIGEETALGLARRGARVVIVGRSRQRGERSLARICAESGNDAARLLLADLASLAEIRRLAQQVLEACPRLQLLVNNAALVTLRRTTTVDGFETMFAVNHLAYFALTNLLLERLVASAPARIVSVASNAHRYGRIDLDDLQSERRFGPMHSYGRTKFANILFTTELARRLEGTGVTANCLHPGGVATRLGRDNGLLGRLATGLLKPFLLSPARGAACSLHLATAPELEGVSGRYFAKLRETRPSPGAQDPELARRLWQLSAELTGLGTGPG